MSNNPALYNAAYSGCLSGLSSRWLTPGAPTTSFTAAARAFAAEVDSKFPQTVITADMAAMMQSLCEGFWSNRLATSSSQDSYSTEAQTIVTLWSEAVTYIEPTVGVLTTVYVNPDTGSDANTGASEDQAVLTLDRAIPLLSTTAEATVMIVMNEGSTTALALGTKLPTAMLNRTASLRIKSTALLTYGDPLELAASTNLILTPLLNPGWSANVVADKFLKVVSSSEAAIVGQVQAISRNTTTVAYPVAGLDATPVPAGTMIQIVSPQAQINCGTLQTIHGGPRQCGNFVIAGNKIQLILDGIRWNFEETVSFIGNVSIMGASEFHSDIPFAYVAFTNASANVGADLNTFVWNGVQFTGTSDIERPYVYGIASDIEFCIVAGYVNITGCLANLYGGYFSQGLDQSDGTVCYPGLGSALFSPSQTTFITGAGFNLINAINSGYQSWQGPMQQVGSSEDIVVSNFCNMKNSSDTTFTGGGVLRAQIGSQVKVSSWAGAPPGGMTFAAGEAGTTVLTAATLAANSKLGPNATDASQIWRVG